MNGQYFIPKRPSRLLLQAICIALCLMGMAGIANGLSVPAKAFAAQILIRGAYAETIETGAPQKPWRWADMETVGRVSVPRLSSGDVVLNAGTTQALSVGPTLIPGSADIGMPGVSVIAAHRDTHFRYLKDIRIGDQVIASGMDGKEHHYKVTRTETVKWDEFGIERGLHENELALVTCYPFDGQTRSPFRFIVYAQLAND